MLKQMLEEKLEKVKPKKMDDMVSVPNKPMYPMFHLDSKALPEIEKWEVGEDYYLVMKVTQKSKDEMEYEGEKKRCHAGFDIKEIGVIEMDDDPVKSELKDKYAQ